MASIINLLRHRWKHFRFQPRAALARYHLAMIDFTTGLGNSAWLLYGLTRSLKPATCVEIGSATGCSACHIGLAQRENVAGRLFAIDPHTATDWNDPGSVDTLALLQHNLRRCGVDRYVDVVCATSEQEERDWTRPIDLIFIDGDHSYDGVKHDGNLFSRHLAPFGVAVFHDTTWELHAAARTDIGVPRFLDELRRAGHP